MDDLFTTWYGKLSAVGLLVGFIMTMLKMYYHDTKRREALYQKREEDRAKEAAEDKAAMLRRIASLEGALINAVVGCSEKTTAIAERSAAAIEGTNQTRRELRNVLRDLSNAVSRLPCNLAQDHGRQWKTPADGTILDPDRTPILGSKTQKANPS